MVDLKSMKKAEILQRAAWKCPVSGHSKHNGLEHPRCYDKLHQLEGERICFLDIETEDLYAEYGVIFCWCILDAKTNKVYKDSITLADIKNYSSKKRNIHPREDKRIIKSLTDKLEQYNRVITHYGSLFDLKFIRTRAVICNVDFPSYGLIYQADTCKILWSKFRLKRNNLGSSTRNLLGKTRKDRLSLSIKHGCIRGEEWAIQTSLKHCENDVLDTRDLYNEIEPFIKKTKTSI